MYHKISMMKKYIFLFLFLSIKLLAQNYSVQSFNTSNSAIPFQNLSQVQSDNANNIWFTGSFSNGENAGLVKFNGNQFTVFNTSNSGIDANYIKRIRTQNGKIWVLHQHSISKFDGNQWTTYNAANEIFLESDFFSNKLFFSILLIMLSILIIFCCICLIMRLIISLLHFFLQS